MSSRIKTFILLVALTALIMLIGGLVGGRSGLVIAFIFAMVMHVGSFWFSDKIVLSMYRARELAPSEAPLLHQMADELARNAGIPKPRVFVVPEKAPNAFATGRNPDVAVVAVTEGILRILEPAELRGVLAHEIAHIANRDILIQGVAAVLASVVMFLANIAQFAAIFGGGRDREGGGGNIAAMLLTALLAPIAATLIQMGISRSREYLADESGARYSGAPEALASALGKLQSHAGQVHMQKENAATAHMFIVNPLTGRSLAGLFSTHPPVEERISRLMRMRRGQGRIS
jgi:heat shock protein HtpX